MVNKKIDPNLFKLERDQKVVSSNDAEDALEEIRRGRQEVEADFPDVQTDDEQEYMHDINARGSDGYLLNVWAREGVIR